MTRVHSINIIDGREVPSLVVTEDYSQVGTHKGTIIVEGGNTTVRGTIEGSLHVEPGLRATIWGKVEGSVHVQAGATVVVRGAIEGSASVSEGATLIIEARGKLAGSVHNEGNVIVRGVFGGSQHGSVPLILEEHGYIKQPIIRDGATIYEW